MKSDSEPKEGDYLAIHIHGNGNSISGKRLLIEYAIVKNVTKINIKSRLTTMEIHYIYEENPKNNDKIQYVTYEDWWAWVDEDEDYIVTDLKELKMCKLYFLQ